MSRPVCSDQTFPKTARVTRGSRFSQVLRRGAVAADGILVLAVLPTDGPGPTRLGITIPKKAGNAVVRNRWKRAIREAHRAVRSTLPPGYDLVVRPKKGAVMCGREIARGWPKLVRRAIDRLPPPVA